MAYIVNHGGAHPGPRPPPRRRNHRHRASRGDGTTLAAFDRVTSKPGDLDRILDELADQEQQVCRAQSARDRLGRARTEEMPAVEDREPSVMVDSGLWKALAHPIECKPQPIKIAIGTIPPPITGVYCVVEQPPDTEEILVIDDVLEVDDNQLDET